MVGKGNKMNDMPQINTTTQGATTVNTLKMQAKGVDVFYGAGGATRSAADMIADKTLTHAIKQVDVDIADKTVTAFIGPSGCGKSTFLRVSPTASIPAGCKT